MLCCLLKDLHNSWLSPSHGSSPPGCCLQIALTLELQRRLDAAGANVCCFAADPGEVLTDITRTLPPPLRAMYKALLPHILFTAQQGAHLDDAIVA